MPKAFKCWTVLSHGPIEKLNSNLWRIEGVLPNMQLKRQMLIAKLSDNTLMIHNAIALEDEFMAEIEAWGTIEYIVVPNSWHRLDCQNYKKRYPKAKVLCPEGALKNVQQVVEVAGSYDSFGCDKVVTLEHLDGIKKMEGILKVRTDSSTTLVFNDLIFNLEHQRGFWGLLMRLIGTTGGPKVTRIMRLFAIKDKEALRAHLLMLATDPNLERIIPGHGKPIEDNATEILNEIALAL